MGGEFWADSKNPTPNKDKLRPVPASEKINTLNKVLRKKEKTITKILYPNRVPSEHDQ